MVYQIKKHTLDRAKELGLKVFASDNPKYKIEVYDGLSGHFLFYGGDANYSDYPSYLESHGREYADERRRLYRIRHQKEINNIGSRGSIIAYLLW
jgi:hypothetical protein